MRITRRTALRTITSLAASIAGLAEGDLAQASDDATTRGKLPPELSIAGYRYDRVAPLADGRVGLGNCGVQFSVDSIGNLNTHVFSGPGTRDVSEVGLHPFILAYVNGGFRDYTLLPIFPLRVFRHKSIFVRKDRGIARPQDLAGKRIATPGYSSTSLTWIRGMLEDEYGIKPSDVEWYVSAKDSTLEDSGGASKFENVLPSNLKIRTGPAGKDESEMLADGDVDALFHAMEPRCYVEGDARVGRLFENFRATEQAYFRKTGIFPIMHAVAIRRKLLDDHPQLARAIFAAYCEAKSISTRQLEKLGWANISLPWIAQEIQDTQKLMGKNYWPYGFDSNRKTLETLCRYSHRQGLASRRIDASELFHPSSRNLIDTGEG